MIDSSDEELVARVVAARDTAAFEALVKRHQSKVRNWLRQLARDGARADDLAQETFLRAWQRAHTFSGKGRFVSWVMKIAYNTFLQAERQNRQRAAIAAAWLEPAVQETAAPDGAEWPDVAKMLAVLSAEERLTMILCHAHGLSHADVATVLEMPLGTVKSHVQRGKAKIRERFRLAPGYDAGRRRCGHD